MNELLGPLAPFIVVVLVGFLPNEVWRMLGVVAARGLDERSDVVVWVRAVAGAILAGVIAKIALFAPGTLADIPLMIRIGAILIGFAAFLALRRSVFAGVLVGEAALMAGAWAAGCFEFALAASRRRKRGLKLLRMRREVLRRLLEGRRRLEGHAVLARDDVDVQVEDDLSAGRLVELLDRHALRVEGLHPGARNLLRYLHHGRQVTRIDVEQVARRRFRNDERMASRTRHDVEEDERLVVFVDLMRGQFAAQDLREDVVGVVGGHPVTPVPSPDFSGMARALQARRAPRPHIGARA
jgi:hypothetical protein